MAKSQSAEEDKQTARRKHPARSALGIDIGGTGIKGAPVDMVHGTLLEDRFRLDTPQPAKPEAVAEVVGQVAKHFEWTGPVGITFPGVVTRGVIRTAANMDPAWIDSQGGRRCSARRSARTCGPWCSTTRTRRASRR
jgi:hypothetical protein